MFTATSVMMLGLFGSFGTPELIVLALLGILLFGKRLPEVGRSIGRGIVEFKKGLQGIEDDVDHATTPKETRPSGQLPAQDQNASVKTDDRPSPQAVEHDKQTRDPAAGD